MNFDRNTIIGFVVLGLLFIGYFYYNNQQHEALLREKARQDSIAQAHMPKVDSAAFRRDSFKIDSQNRAISAGSFLAAANGTEQVTQINNELITVAFTNKGGQVKWVELKNFKDPSGNNLRLAGSNFDKFSYVIKTAPNQSADISNFYFTPGPKKVNADGSQTISFQLQGNGASIAHEFVVRRDNYMIDFNLLLNGIPQLTSNNSLNVLWQNRAVQLQKDLNYEKQQSQISYRVNGDYDHSSAVNSGDEKFEKPVNWVAVKQQFFNSTLINKDNFSSGSINWTIPAKGNTTSSGNNTIVDATANLNIQLPAATSGIVHLAMYYGPTDYKLLKQYGNDMEDMVNLGSGMFAFVKYINRWIVIPVFDLFRKFTSNFGIVILLLTLFIRLLISPLTYSSYLSGAKMKVLRPEIDVLRAKYGNDQQQISMEQMKLFREAGVNPMGGCIPGLFQIPIFFALYSFFNSNVALRGESFLWAKDLSQYDSILNLPFTIPFYGDHVSLFTITATLTSFLISLYSMSMTPDQSNPVLKWMPYFFPIMLLFIFNKLPSGLTWYYTVSNLITLALQFVIQNYIINHDKILAKIEENRRKPKTKSKWQERIEAMQDQQKKVQEMQQKTRK
ncbi:membrane protein insertase YidC [Chitinophagaceae bacterium LB-8]|uniref:Membrane protein insertase YidC n=1 Tax=Paraflavisolibacter caeni TaxID=2982496 RepID=A0A9X2XTQ2_9BACT|nr:membrane protein insertase YidC [Paraflavisolibacter caeni]MCU7548640.1 membrane protein insertase YidC [Paraflavisolibacter caeni]